MLLFRSEEHVDRWCRQRGTERGGLVSLDQLWALGGCVVGRDPGARVATANAGRSPGILRFGGTDRLLLEASAVGTRRSPGKMGLDQRRRGIDGRLRGGGGRGGLG